MDMDGTNTTMTMGGAMTPYLHFTRGDYLLFKTLKPSSAAAVVGACIGLVLLAIFDRWLSAARSTLNSHWRRKGLTLASLGVTPTTESRPTEDAEKFSHLNSDGALNKLEPPKPNSTRTIPPFIFSHDVPRGLLHASQALLAYVLMLSVMTFNAAYIISIVAGLSIGEVVFGRMGSGRTH